MQIDSPVLRAGVTTLARQAEVFPVCGTGTPRQQVEAIIAELDRKLAAGRHVVGDLMQIATAGRRVAQSPHVQQHVQPAPPSQHGQPAAAPLQDAKAIAEAAQAFSERLRHKAIGRAA